MTHHTDAWRAEFEAWARGYGTWEVKRDDDVALGTTGYTDITLTVAWHAVQAARRAPAVQSMTLEQAAASMRATQAQPARIIAASGSCAPAAPVPQGVVEPIDTVKYWRDAYANPQGDEHFMGHGMVVKIFDDYLGMLAAAPQPPEAAPVQLPEPVAYQWLSTDNFRISGGPVSGAYWNKLYTEQQVRELLAAQAAVSNGTLASQPPFQTEAGAARQLEEIAVLVRVLVRALRKADPANPRAARALDYLKRHGLQGNPLRAPGD